MLEYSWNETNRTSTFFIHDSLYLQSLQKIVLITDITFIVEENSIFFFFLKEPSSQKDISFENKWCDFKH